MPLASAGDLLASAALNHGAVGAFNVVLLEQAEALVEAAERAGLPLILQISENCVHYHGSVAPLARATLELAAASQQAVCVQLDHATSPELVARSIEVGLQAVMFDASELDYDDNVEQTALVVSTSHRRGVWVEAELGAVGGKGGVHAPGVRTDPTQARLFVVATGVDALAVAIGTQHRMTSRDATIDLALLEHLHEVVSCPLVLHGSSGVSDEDLRKAVKGGIRKVNLATHLNVVFTEAIRCFLTEHHDAVDPRHYVSAGRTALSTEAARLLTLLADV